MKAISLVKGPDEDKVLGELYSPSDYGTRVNLSGPKSLATLPKCGTITFKFERMSVKVTEEEEDPVSLELKLLSIEDAEECDVSDAEKVDEESAGEAIDRLLSDADDEESEDDSED